MTGIAWLPWGADAFARARHERKPVLLSLAPSWCRFSDLMDRTSFASPAVASLVNEHFVAVRVDADRRPDVSERYGLGGWPTTAFLTPEGDILGGGTYVDPARLTAVLERVREAFASGRHVRPRRPGDARTPAPSTAASPEELIAQVFAAFDSENGGFGTAPKFPQVAPVRLALELYTATGQEGFREIAVTTLDLMGWGPLHDERDGGFFRYANNADWSEPHDEKLLDVNASLLALYLDAFEVLGLARYRERAEDVLRYVQTWLADTADGGWAASQRSDPSYYGRGPARVDGDIPAPPVDRTLFCDWNAMMASAALQAGRVLEDSGLSEFAIRSLERVVPLLYKPGAGVAHYADVEAPDRDPPGPLLEVRGLLDDQIAMGTALLDAFDATASVPYEMLARELGLYAIRTMWDEESGGFFDRAGDARRDVGLLRRPVKPFGPNCRAGRLLARLARTSSSTELADYADRTLAAMSGRASAEGALAAEYVLSLRDAARQ